MRVEELVGQRIRARREELELTQEQLGERLGEILGRKWSRQAVSAAEKGDRAFTAAELVAIAFTLGRSLGDLFAPLAGVDALEMPGGARLPRADVMAAVLPRMSGVSSLRDMHDTLAQLSEHIGAAAEGSRLAAADAQTLNMQFLMAAGLVSAATNSASKGLSNYDRATGEWEPAGGEQ